MYGAILGDMIGAPYEFDRGNKTKDFPLFSRRSEFTDDSVMTIAVAEALMNTLGRSDEEIKNALVASMQKWGHMYPDAGYGGRFYHWLRARHPEPYGSYETAPLCGYLPQAGCLRHWKKPGAWPN